MVETKPFKTKLCVLHQRGRCGRQTCTFAHGDYELRRFSDSFNDRRDDRGFDLRSKLDERRSPPRRYSPGRDVRGWRGNQRFRPVQPVKRRNYGRHDIVDGQSDLHESYKVSERAADHKDKFRGLSDSRDTLDYELKQVQYDIDELLDQKDHLEIELQERVQETDILTSRIRDVEAQLGEEKDKSKRINSKIKKLIRAHGHHVQLQDELKRSQVQLQKLVDGLGLDAAQHIGSEDNSNINIISDEEIPNIKRGHTSPAKKPIQLHSSMETPRVSKLANVMKGNKVRIEESSRRNSLAHFNGNKELDVGNKRKETEPSQYNENKSKRRKDASKGFAYFDKSKVLESNIVVPPTSMAAHAVDDFVDQSELDDKTESFETSAVNQIGLPFPLPPLPSISRNNYVKYKGDDENVDVDGLEEGAEEVDIV